MSVIRDILVFYSDNSAACSSVKGFIDTQGLPVSMICIDSRAARESIKNGKLKIRYVPSLAVIYEDMKAEVYEGDVKVLSWLYKTFERKLKDVSQPMETDAHQPTGYQPNGYQPNGYQQSSPPPKQSQPLPKPADKDDASPKSDNSKNLSKMEQIQALAREMEEQRRKTLKIDDNDS